MKDMDKWLELLSDEQRADVMKTKIAEEAKTERTRIDQLEQSKRTAIGSDGHHVVRGLWVFAAILATLCATCVGHRQVEAWQAVKLGDPTVVKGFPPPPPKP